MMAMTILARRTDIAETTGEDSLPLPIMPSQTKAQDAPGQLSDSA